MTLRPRDFEHFTEGDWVNWLADSLAGLTPLPSGPSSDMELHHVLGDVFENLRSPRDRRLFESALETILAGISFTPNASSEIFTVLHLVALVKPPSAPRILERRILDGSFSGYEYASLDLEDYAITVRSQSIITPEFLSFLQSCMRLAVPATRRFVAARCLTLVDSQSTRQALNLTFQMLGSDDHEEEQFSVLLRDVWLRLGGAVLFDWYESLQDDAPSEMRTKLDRLLSERVLPWDSRENFDDYGLLLSAQVHAESCLINMHDLVSIAHLETVAGSARVRSTLGRIWTALRARRGTSEPWLSIDARDLTNVFRRPSPDPYFKYGADGQTLQSWQSTAALLEEIGLQDALARGYAP